MTKIDPLLWGEISLFLGVIAAVMAVIAVVGLVSTIVDIIVTTRRWKKGDWS